VRSITIQDSTSGGVRVVNIWVHKGHTLVFGSASNAVATHVGTGGVVDEWTVGRDDLPISIDDLIEILVARELTLFPEA
jgi:hypothetical protein